MVPVALAVREAQEAVTIQANPAAPVAPDHPAHLVHPEDLVGICLLCSAVRNPAKNYLKIYNVC